MQEQLSAIVLLRPAAGGDVGNVARAATAEQLLPDPSVVRDSQEHLQAQGFEVMRAVGPSFSIVAPWELFEKVFGVKLERDEKGGVRTVEGSLELPIDAFPPELRTSIQAVTFTPPPEFGPTEYA